MPAIIFGLWVFGAQALYNAPETGWNSKADFIASVEKAIDEQVVVKTQAEYTARYND